MNDLRAAAQQALAHVQEFKRRWMAVPPFGNKVNKATREAVTLAHVPVLQIEEALRAALAQQEQPKPVAWGLFAKTDGQWVLQYPVFVGECGKANAERERASYSGPTPLEVRPLGVVTNPPRRETEQEQDWSMLEATQQSLREHMAEIHRLRKALEEQEQEQEQEPVAWMVYTQDGKSVCVTDNPADFTDEHRALPLFTHPPRREWRSLSEEEIAALYVNWDATPGVSMADFARAIEAVLRSKNHG